MLCSRMAIHTHGDSELEAINVVTARIIGGAIEVHRHLGPGLSERVYGDALAIEMNERAHNYEREVHRPVTYKGHTLGRYVIDFIVKRRVIVEVKSVCVCGDELRSLCLCASPAVQPVLRASASLWPFSSASRYLRG